VSLQPPDDLRARASNSRINLVGARIGLEGDEHLHHWPGGSWNAPSIQTDHVGDLSIRFGLAMNGEHRQRESACCCLDQHCRKSVVAAVIGATGCQHWTRGQDGQRQEQPREPHWSRPKSRGPKGPGLIGAPWTEPQGEIQKCRREKGVPRGVGMPQAGFRCERDAAIYEHQPNSGANANRKDSAYLFLTAGCGQRLAAPRAVLAGWCRWSLALVTRPRTYMQTDKSLVVPPGWPGAGIFDRV